VSEVSESSKDSLRSAIAFARVFIREGQRQLMEEPNQLPMATEQLNLAVFKCLLVGTSSCHVEVPSVAKPSCE
jgi:hypothetical protein